MSTPCIPLCTSSYTERLPAVPCSSLAASLPICCYYYFYYYFTPTPLLLVPTYSSHTHLSLVAPVFSRNDPHRVSPCFSHLPPPVAPDSNSPRAPCCSFTSAIFCTSSRLGFAQAFRLCICRVSLSIYLVVACPSQQPCPSAAALPHSAHVSIHAICVLCTKYTRTHTHTRTHVLSNPAPSMTPVVPNPAISVRLLQFAGYGVLGRVVQRALRYAVT